MTRVRLALAALLIAATSACYLLFPPPPASPVIGPPPSEPEPTRAAQRDPPDRYTQPIDVLWYHVELSLPDSADFFLGSALVRMARREATGSVVLDLTGLYVDSVMVRGERVEASLEGDRLTVALPAGANDTVDVEVRYRGVPDDGLVIAPDVHGDGAVFADNWPNRARFWFPSVDHPSDKAQVSFTVHAPEGWKVIANGRPAAPPDTTRRSVRVPDLARRRTWRWETVTPIPTYTMVVGAGYLETRTIGLAACGQAPASPRPDGCVEVSWWATVADTITANRVFRRAPEMVQFFTSWIGDFPYEKLANVQSATRFGGMENASAIFYSGDALARGQDIEGTVSHEIAHQWFGDSVTPRDWTHLWLSEGFASYFGALFFEQADGAEAFRTQMNRYRQRYLASEDVNNPIVDPEVTDLYALLNRNNYDKGAWVLHMLRGLIGDDAFRAGIRLYYARHVHGTAETDDLRAAMEQVSGRSLEEFFQQWVFERGYPVFRTSHGYDARRGEAIVVITQVQNVDWTRFRMPLELELAWEGGSRRERVNIVNAREVFTFYAPGPLTSVTIDPDGWLLYAREGEVPR